RRQPQPAGRQCYGRELSQQRVGGKATGTAAPDRAQSDNNCRDVGELEQSRYRGGAKRPAGRRASDRAAIDRPRCQQRPRNRDRLYNARPTRGWRAARGHRRVHELPTGTDCRAGGPIQDPRDLQLARSGRCRRPDELRAQHYRCIPSSRHLCRTHPERREAGRSAGYAADEVRTGDQSHDCKGAWPRNSRQVAGTGRRGDRMTAKMKRRQFITLLGGAAAAWPLVARGQQAGSIARIGLLWPGDAPPVSPRVEAFRRGLRALGFLDWQDIAIELRYAQRGPEQLPELAAELIRLKVDVIFASGDLAPKVAQQATETIPIVAISDDILGAGVIASLSRPGGNTTGLTILSPELSAKR